MNSADPTREPLQATKGLKFDRVFSDPDVHPFDAIDWRKTTSEIKDEHGKVIFSQEIEIPAQWSDQAGRVVSSKYFYGDIAGGNDPSKGGRESSARQLVGRVTGTIAAWGKAGGYFASDEDARAFEDELTALCIGQYGAFNSPVWFNVGLSRAYGIKGAANGWRWDKAIDKIIRTEDIFEHPQGSACFLQSIKDDMESIGDLIKSEMILFKGGSGTGTDLSPLRSSKEKLSGGGVPSGPVSFMKVYDAAAGVIKSGGRTRRSAKMQLLRCDHPDIREFVECKAKEEAKARALIVAGYDSSFNGEAYASVAFQNANLSVSVTDEFMEKAGLPDGQARDRDFNLLAVTTGKPIETVDAKEMLDTISAATHGSGDPGMFFVDTINKWHTSPADGPIVTCNPCGEYLYVNDSACNLASINLMKFRNDDGTFDADRYQSACRTFLVAQEILVDRASYPTEKIAYNSHRLHPLGLGYCGLGALIMSGGFPYDSDEGRMLASLVTSIMTAKAYLTSIEMAQVKGPFEGYEANREPFMKVMEMHREASRKVVVPDDCPEYFDWLDRLSFELWDQVVSMGVVHGFRNGQVSLVAPTGCVTADTMILSSEGLLPIGLLGDTEGPQWQEADFQISQEDRGESATKFYVNGTQRVVEVLSNAGHSIRATEKHRIRVIDETGEYAWRRMSDVNPGDHLVMKLGGHSELMGDKPGVRFQSLADCGLMPETLEDDFSELLGFYMGNGYTKETGGLHLIINDADMDLRDRFDRAMESSGLKSTWEEKQGCGSLTYNSRAVAPWFEANGLSKDKGNRGEGAASADIPEVVLRSRTSVLAAFLRGLFTADGTIGGVGRGTPVIEMSTVSHSLARKVQIALESLEIRARLSVETERKNAFGDRPLYRVRLVSIEDCRTFAEIVGFASNRKADRLAEALVIASDSTVIDGDCVAHQVLIDDLYLASEGLASGVRQDIAVRKRQGRFNTSWAARLIAAHSQLASSKIARILGLGKVQIIPVESATLLDDPEPTFDLSVPERNTYVANGFISHNTIAFLMDSGHSTGLEPGLALVQYKTLAGGGMLKIVNPDVERALRTLGYDQDAIEDTLAFIESFDTIEGAPKFDPKHLPIFDCAFPPPNGSRAISWQGHIKMLAAIQPFISGSSSKTVNMPKDSTVEDISGAYLMAWRLGVKDVAIYRDGSKESQPVSTSKAKSEPPEAIKLLSAEIVEAWGDKAIATATHEPRRTRLPDTRRAVTHKLSVGSVEAYLTVGEFDDGRPGELFVSIAKEGSTLAGMMDAWATAVSIMLQYGIPLDVIVGKFAGGRFEPAGMTRNPAEIPIASSLIDYVARWLGMRYMAGYREANAPRVDGYDVVTLATVGGETGGGSVEVAENSYQVDTTASTVAHSPICPKCGSLTVPTGRCFGCPSCGESIGGCG